MDMIEFKGADALQKKLKNLAECEGLEKAMQKSCAIVEREAKQKAPKDTGELRRSITSKVETEDGNLVGIVYTPLEYAPYVEYGTGLFAVDGNGRMDVPWNYQDDEGNWYSTSGMKPQPFMSPALNENREEILRLLMEGVLDD